jgi:phosphate-selective porin OprO/OprP
VRYDYADLTDAYDTLDASSRPLSQDAGKYTAWTLGANYYLTGYVRFQANYTDGGRQPVRTAARTSSNSSCARRLDF